MAQYNVGCYRLIHSLINKIERHSRRPGYWRKYAKLCADGTLQIRKRDVVARKQAAEGPRKREIVYVGTMERIVPAIRDRRIIDVDPLYLEVFNVRTLCKEATEVVQQRIW